MAELESKKEETKPSTIKEILSKDFTHIFIIFVSSVILILINSYIEPLYYFIFPILGGTINMQLILEFIVFLPIVADIDIGLLFVFGGWYMFQSTLVIVSIMLLFVGISYYLIHKVIEWIGLEITRTKIHKTFKVLGLYAGIGIGLFLVVYNYKMENLFNYNLITIYILNVTDYFQHIFEFVFMIGTTGLFFGYFAILIVDILFIGYYKIMQRKFYRVTVKKGYTTKLEKRIISKLGINFANKTKLSKGFSVFLISLIIVTSAFMFNVVLDRDTTIRVRFSPNFNVVGEYRNVTSWGFIMGIGLYSAPFDLLEMLSLDWVSIGSESIIQAMIPFLSDFKLMALNMFYLSNLEFTFKVPKNYNTLGLSIFFLYKMNPEDEIAMGGGFFPYYIENTFFSKTITIHGLYTNYYRAGSNGTMGSVSAYPLYTVENNYNPFDYLFF